LNVAFIDSLKTYTVIEVNTWFNEVMMLILG